MDKPSSFSFLFKIGINHVYTELDEHVFDTSILLFPSPLPERPLSNIEGHQFKFTMVSYNEACTHYVLHKNKEQIRNQKKKR
jgi:hypothetical protein